MVLFKDSLAQWAPVRRNGTENDTDASQSTTRTFPCVVFAVLKSHSSYEGVRGRRCPPSRNSLYSLEPEGPECVVGRP